MSTTYKIYRQRQNELHWTDITSHYDSTCEINGDVFEHVAFAYAEEYKKKHKSDNVKVVEINRTEHEITLQSKKHK